MSRAKLVALDVDGTLLTYDGAMSSAVREAVGAVLDAGLAVVLATGRSVAGLLPVAAELGITTGWAVCSNGAVTLRLDAAEPEGYALHDVITFDPAPALRALRIELPDAIIAVEEIGVGFRVTRPFPDGELKGVSVVTPFEDLLTRPVTRVALRLPEGTAAEFHDVVERIGLHEVSYAVGWSAWLDLSPGGVSKASALEAVRREIGVEPFATVAVGDGSNDIEMLRWAARGVAMGNALPGVREAADEVTGTVDDDGVVPVLRSLLA